MANFPSTTVPSPARERRRQSLLKRAMKTPTLVLDDRRCWKDEFCALFLERCDELALAASGTGHEHASVGLELALKTGSPHLVNRSLDVYVGSYFSIGKLDEARDVLDGYRAQAFGCCPSCKRDWQRRRGDLFVELRDPERALRHLGSALPASVAEPDVLGRTNFLLGVAHYHAGERERALTCELDAWRHIEMTPERHAYLRDTTSYVGIFLRGADPSADRRVLGHLARFKKRLAIPGDWTEARAYLRWLEGLLAARRGDFKAAAERLDRVRRHFLKAGPTRVAVAVTVDLAMVYSRSRRLHRQTIDAISPLLSRCLQSPPEPLLTELKRGLEEVSKVLDARPWNVFDALVAFRSSFVVPIPGILAERIGIV